MDPRRRAPSLVRSVASFGVWQVPSWAVSAVLVVMLPRYLGDTGLGAYGFALALTQLAALAANLGTAAYLTREVARRPSEAPALVGAALLTRLPLAALAAAACLLAASRLQLAGSTRVAVAVLAAWIAIDSVRAVVQGALQGLQRLRTLAAFPAVSNATYVAGVGSLVGSGSAAGAPGVAAAYAAGQLAGLAVSTGQLLRTLRPSFSASPALWLRLLGGGFPFFVWQAALVVYGQVDAVLLALLSGEAAVGWYVAAYRIVAFPMFIPTILMTVVYPALAAAADDRLALRRIANPALLAALLATVPAAGGLALLAPQLVTALGYPEAFSHSVAPMAILAVGLPLVAADMLIGTVLNSIGRQRAWALTAVAAAIFNPLANLVAIPLSASLLGNPADGAAAVTTATEVFMLVAGLRLLPGGLVERRTFSRAARIIAATAVMAAVVVAAGRLPLPALIPLAAAAYCASVLALRAISHAELSAVFSELRVRRLQEAA